MAKNNSIKGIYNTFFGNGEGRNVVSLFMSSSIINIIPLLITPILSRIYTPHDYGIAAIFSSILSLHGAFFNSHYNHSLILQENNSKISNNVFLILLINVIFCIVLWFIFFLLRGIILNFCIISNLPKLTFIILPICALLIGFNSGVNTILIKTSRYKWLNTLGFLTMSIALIIQVVLAMILPQFAHYQPDYRILILIQICTVVFNTIFAIIFLFKVDSSFLKHFNFKTIMMIAKKDKIFFQFSVINDVLLIIVKELPTILMSKLLTLREIGGINYGNRFLSLPTNIASNSVSNVVGRKMVEQIEDKNECTLLFIKVFWSSFLLGLIPTIIVTLYGGSIFAFVFGKEWRIAGQFSSILVFYYFLNFVSAPLSYLFILRKKILEDLLIHIYLVLSCLFFIFLGYKIFNSAKGVLLLYVINYCLVYIYYLIRSYFLSLPPEKELITKEDI